METVFENEIPVWIGIQIRSQREYYYMRNLFMHTQFY